MTTNVVLVIAAFAVLLAAEAIYYLVLYLGQQRRAELKRRLPMIIPPVVQDQAV